MRGTPKEMVKEADSACVEFSVANAPGEVRINITKKEALRLITAHNLPADDVMHEVGFVTLHGDQAVIVFAT